MKEVLCALSVTLLICFCLGAMALSFFLPFILLGWWVFG
jgi:hypothetical protein